MQLESLYCDLLDRVRGGEGPDPALDDDLWLLTDAEATGVGRGSPTFSLDDALQLSNSLLNRRSGQHSWRIDIMTDGTAIVSLGVQDRAGNMRIFESRDSERLSPPRATVDVLLQALLD